MVVAMVLAQALPAQDADASLQGVVLDASKSPIQGASVTISTADHTLSQVVTDARGSFSTPLARGTYSIRIIADGFQETTGSVEIQGEPVVREFNLQVAARREMVTVTEFPSYQVATISSGTKTQTPLLNIPQSITIVTQELMRDQMMMSIADVVRYTPGITAHQGENNRDQVVIRGNNSSADFFVNGVRDDVQYFRDLYNLERVEALKGPNAMIFGRGGGGGVINRVTKEAGFMPLREITLLGGSFNSKRFATDFDHPLSEKAALRLNGIYENSGSFRNQVGLERYGVSPTFTYMPSAFTKFVVAFEHFRDYRTADRGIPSYLGRPLDIDIATFYGNPNDSYVKARVNVGTVAIDHQVGRVGLRNRTMVGDYDRSYRNYVPGAVTTAKTQVNLSAYDTETARRNVFNQTDATYAVSTGGIQHMLLGGVEVGRQETDNFRRTGFFNDSAANILIPFSSTAIQTPITFRQNSTDAANHVAANIGATYLQDQIHLSRFVQVVAGLRFDRFDLRFQNHRNNDHLRRIDNLLSPRVGIVLKPANPLSVYANYSVSYLPSSGDQFASLTTITQQVKPEKFMNYEAGVKWDISRDLSLTTAVYRLDRTNTRATDPNDPTRIVQTGRQRTNGYELGLNGSLTRKWRLAGGYAYQDAYITDATIEARLGARVAQVPYHTFSLWNHYQFLRRWSGGVGIVQRSDMFAAVDNTVVLPGYTRVDAAVYYSLTERIRIQANVENLANITYFTNAHTNNNISPGYPRAVRIGLTARF